MERSYSHRQAAACAKAEYCFPASFRTCSVLWEPLARAPLASGIGRGPGWLHSLRTIPPALEAELIGAGMNFPAGQSVLLVGEKR